MLILSICNNLRITDGLPCDGRTDEVISTNVNISNPLNRPYLNCTSNIIDFGSPVTSGDDEIRGVYEVVFSKLQKLDGLKI